VTGSTDQSSPDRWDRILAFHKSKLSIAVAVVALLFIMALNNSVWTVPIKIALLVLGAAYWAAVGIKSVRGFRAEYRAND
jgi:hypothetical protein